VTVGRRQARRQALRPGPADPRRLPGPDARGHRRLPRLRIFRRARTRWRAERMRGRSD